MSRTCAWQSSMCFIDEFIDFFESVYLRPPINKDHRRLLVVNSQPGFFECVGSGDRRHWEWKNCSVTWPVQFKWKRGKPSIVSEVVADEELWIRVCHFGKLGTTSDINISDFSPKITSIFKEDPLPELEYTVNKIVQKNLYVFLDIIYPPYSIFVSTLPGVTTEKERAFAST